MTTTKRPLDQDDRAFLDEIQMMLDFHEPSKIGAILKTALLTLLFGGVLSAFWIAYCEHSGIIISGIPWHQLIAPKSGVIAIFGATFTLVTTYQAKAYLRVREWAEALKAKVALELQHDEVEVTKVLVDDVKSFFDPEHETYIYFLRLSDGRIRVRYNFEADDPDEFHSIGRTDFPVSRELTMVRFKHVDETRYCFGGPEIPILHIGNLAPPPEEWPDNHSWSAVPWEKLDQVYGEKNSTG